MCALPPQLAKHLLAAMLLLLTLSSKPKAFSALPSLKLLLLFVGTVLFAKLNLRADSPKDSSSLLDCKNFWNVGREKMPTAGEKYLARILPVTVVVAEQWSQQARRHHEAVVREFVDAAGDCIWKPRAVGHYVDEPDTP